ncbi:MAG: CotD family spore coat protein [Solibacillus sp.]
MVNRSWFDLFGGNTGQNFGDFSNFTELPEQTAATQYEQPRMSPQQQYVQRNVTNMVVPHYHPSHLTTVNQHFIRNEHHFPHTQSVVNECYETHTMCGTPFMPHRCQCRNGCSRCGKR